MNIEKVTVYIITHNTQWFMFSLCTYNIFQLTQISKDNIRKIIYKYILCLAHIHAAGFSILPLVERVTLFLTYILFTFSILLLFFYTLFHINYIPTPSTRSWPRQWSKLGCHTVKLVEYRIKMFLHFLLVVL